MFQRIIIFFAIIGSLSDKCYSQKIDLDKETWTHNFVHLPLIKDLTSLKTYSVSIFADSENLNRIGLSSDKIEASVKLDGFVYINGLADIDIEITIEDFKKISEEIKTKEQTVYEGGKNVTTKTYIPTTSYSAPTTFKVLVSPDQRLIMNSAIASQQNLVIITSGEYPTQEGASSQFKGTDDKRLEAFKEKYYSMFLAELNSFREKYDFVKSNESEIFWHIDLKKSPEYAEFNDKLKVAKEIFASIKPSDDVKVIREKLLPTMQYLRENADKLASDDKKNRKLKYAYLLNLSKIQMWLDLTDESSISAQQVVDNDYDKSDGKLLLRKLNLLKEELKNSPNASRHFERAGFTSPARFSASEIKPLQLKAAILAQKSKAVIPVQKPNSANTDSKTTESSNPVGIQSTNPVQSSVPAAPPSEQETKKHLELAFAFKFVEGILSDGFIVPGELVFDQSKKLTGMKYFKNWFPDRGKVTNEGVLSAYYYNGNVLSGAIFTSACNSTNLSLEGINVEYDQLNRVTKITNSWSRSSKQRLVTNSFFITYQGNRITKVEKHELQGEGNIKKPTLIKDVLQSSVTIEWKNDTEVVTNYSELTYASNQYVFKPRWSRTLRVSGKETYTDYVGSDNSRRSVEFKVSANEVIQTVIDDGKKIVTRFSLDEKGRVTKIISGNPDSQERTETTVTYILKEANLPADDLCSYNHKNMVSVYDASGMLVQESNDRQIRRRNPDGTWGPWKDFTY